MFDREQDLRWLTEESVFGVKKIGQESIEIRLSSAGGGTMIRPADYILDLITSDEVPQANIDKLAAVLS